MAGAVTWDRAVLNRFKTILEDYLAAELATQTAGESWNLSAPSASSIVISRTFTPPDRTSQIQLFVRTSYDQKKQFINFSAPKKRVVEVILRCWVSDVDPEDVEEMRTAIATSVAKTISDKWTADSNPAKLTNVKVDIPHSESSEHQADEARGALGQAFGQAASQNANITFIDVVAICNQRVAHDVTF